jgi:hypothetical protein
VSNNNAVVIQYLETLRGICSLLEKISYDETGTCVDDVIEALKQSLAQPQAPVVPEGEYLCPNCVTPWKCNGPHIPEPAQRDERAEYERHMSLINPCKDVFDEHQCERIMQLTWCTWQACAASRSKP